jgi:hypothetical protein
MNDRTLYFAAGLFALAAAINIVSDGRADLGAVLELIAAAAFAFVGLRDKRPAA